MKKFLTIAAGVAVLAGGVYIEPAKAQHHYQGTASGTAGNRTTNTNIINGDGNVIRQTTVNHNHIRQTMPGYTWLPCRKHGPDGCLDPVYN